METQNNTAFSLSAEELEFCISALQIEIEEVERVMQDRTVTPDEKMEFEAYIQKLDAIQDQFLMENNSFLLCGPAAGISAGTAGTGLHE